MKITGRFRMQAAAALAIGATIVCAAAYLNHHCAPVETPTFLLLLPGILCGQLAPDAITDLKDSTPSGPIAMFILWAVNIGLYSGLACLAIVLIAAKKSVTRSDPVSLTNH